MANFPNSPATGDSYTLAGVTYVYDGSAWKAAIGVGNVLAIQVFTSSGTYTPTTGMEYCVIEVVGSGAAGGGAAQSTGLGQGGGGGGGGYSRKLASAATIGTSQTVTINNGGTAGSAGNSAGNAPAGDNSVGSICIGKAGSAGSGAAANNGGAGGAGGVAGTGDFTCPGGRGMNGAQGADTTTAILASGGPAGFGFSAPSAGGVGAGAAGVLYGGGGMGGSSYNNSAAVAGGAGGKGIAIITEYTRSSPAPGVSSSTDNTVPRFNGTAGLLQTSNVTIDDNGGITAASSDAGAVGPLIIQQHLSATPAANDIIGGLWCFGKDSAANTQEYCALYATITDTTSGSEDSRWDLYTYNAGAATSMAFYPGGIQFPASQISNSNANTLDDYEEGTWTPAVAFGGSSTNVTYSLQTGNYTKIGNLVEAYFWFTLTNNGTGTGNCTVTGYPFTFSNWVPGKGSLSAGGSSASGIYPLGIVGGGTIGIFLPSATADGYAQHTNVTDTCSMIGSIVHRV